MKKILLLFFIITVFSKGLYSQKNNISGNISDEGTGERLIGVSLYDKNGNGSTTNEYGFFSLNVEKNNELIISFIGYKTKYLKLNRDTVINISLKRLNNEIEEVIITDNIDFNNIKISSHSISIPDIKKIPAIGGETDIIKAIQLLPGIQSGTEGTTGLFVRGGGSDQNLIIVDDVPLYNISHLFGFLSVFNENAIKNIEIIKSGFPARYGGRLSSVVDIRTKDGNMNKLTGSYEMGLLSSKFLIEGPLIKNKSSFLLTARRTWTDLFTIPASFIGNKVVGSKGSHGYFFYDINAKYNHIFSNKKRLYINLFHSTDKQYYIEERENTQNDKIIKRKEQFDFKWKNTMFSIRFNHIYNKKLFSNITAYFLNYNISYFEEYNFENNTNYSFYNYLSKTGINDYGLHYKIDYVLNKQYIRFGINAVRHQFIPKLNVSYNNKKTEYDTETLSSYEYRAYIEDDISFLSNLKANIGMHISSVFVKNSNYKFLEPRFSLSYTPIKKLTIKTSYAEMNQFMHLLTSSGAGIPTDMYVPVSENIPPQNSKQFSLGIYSKVNSVYNFSIEAYYKSMDDLIVYKTGENTILAILNYSESVISGGKGKSYGTEVSLNKTHGKFKGNINYTLSKSTRQFDLLNRGKEFPFKFDRRHDISVLLSYDINKNVSINFLWLYGTGNSLTLPVGVYHSDFYPGSITDSHFGETDNNSPVSFFAHNDNIMFGDLLYYGERNSVKLPAYHRADIAINFKKNKKRGVRTFKVGLYNIYNHKNPFLVTFDYETVNNGYTITTGYYKIKSLFPILPIISYSFKFK